MAVGFYELTGKLIPQGKAERGIHLTYRSQAGVRVKMDQSRPPYAVANEYISAELAKHIRLPIPPHFLAKLRTSGDAVFCSLDATVKGATLPPINPVEAVQEEPDLCTGVLLFDIWIANADRHLKNIAYQSKREPHKLTIFDHSEAPFLYTDFATRNRYSLGVVRHDGMRHCLLDVLHTPDYFDKWIRRIEGVPNEYIAEILRDAMELGLPEIVRTMGYDHLRSRRDGLGSLIRSNRAQFTAIADWGLLWGT